MMDRERQPMRPDAGSTAASPLTGSGTVSRAARRGLMVLALMVLAGIGPAKACGPDSDGVVGERTYRIRLPAPAPGGDRIGAILFAHGHGGTAAEIMADDDLARAATELGVALIVLQPAPRGWVLPGSPAAVAGEPGDETGYVDQVVADASRRFSIAPRRILVSGISAGGMLVWTPACERGASFGGFAPIAGTSWTPLPRDCPSLPSMPRHIDGTADRVVPLEGRPVRQSRQGNVFLAVALLAGLGGYGPPRRVELDGLDCSLQHNAAGADLALCLHGEGHVYRVRDIVAAWRALAARPGF
jgi:polyhydroxybutyrate depolymerase